VCTKDFPCQQSGSTYSCRGQFAEWVPVLTSSSFQIGGDGTVTDARSGLVWQQTVDESVHDWEGAKRYCAQRGTGWRLPSKAELESIYEEDLPAPSLDMQVFPKAPDVWFWTGSPLAKHGDAAWYVMRGSAHSTKTSQQFQVRCVR